MSTSQMLAESCLFLCLMLKHDWVQAGGVLCAHRPLLLLGTLVFKTYGPLLAPVAQHILLEDVLHLSGYDGRVEIVIPLSERLRSDIGSFQIYAFAPVPTSLAHDIRFLRGGRHVVEVDVPSIKLAGMEMMIHGGRVLVVAMVLICLLDGLGVPKEHVDAGVLMARGDHEGLVVVFILVRGLSEALAAVEILNRYSLFENLVSIVIPN